MKSINILLLICFVLMLCSSCKVTDSQNETESISYYIPTIEETTKAYKIDNNTVNLSSISFIIPQNFEPETENGELLLKSKDSTVEISVEDATETTDDFDTYIQETTEYFRQMGLSPSAVEETYIGNYTSKRFAIDTFAATSSNVKIFCYFIKTNKCKIVVNIVSKDGEIITFEQADKLVEKFEFTES